VDRAGMGRLIHIHPIDSAHGLKSIRFN
jgi:hypothetical protein